MLEILWSLFDPITGAAVGSGATYAGQKLKKRFYDRRTIRGVFDFAASPTNVFIPLSVRDSGIGAASGYGDLLALSEFLVVTEALHNKRTHINVHPAQGDFSTLRRDNIVIIGGGKYNKIYLDIIDKLMPPLHFWDTPEKSNKEIRNKDSTNIFQPKFNEAGEVLYDIGFALRAPNPYNAEKTVIITAGSSSYGSAAAMKYLCDPKTGKEMISKNRLRSIAVIGCNINNHNIDGVKRISGVEGW